MKYLWLALLSLSVLPFAHANRESGGNDESGPRRNPDSGVSEPFSITCHDEVLRGNSKTVVTAQINGREELDWISIDTSAPHLLRMATPTDGKLTKLRLSMPTQALPLKPVVRGGLELL